MELNMVNKQLDVNDDEVIRINGLKVWTPEEKSWWRRKVIKPQGLILNGVSGCIKEGEFAALIGPSGAGKTTFLVSLAGKCTLPSDGSVTVNGRNVKQGAVEIVPQFEVFMDSLSVKEHLIFMTEMKLGNYKKPHNNVILNTLIRDLKLKSHLNTPIKGLSGGERRLLSLASSLLSNPQILICDEPTTGLDSYNALLVIGVLKKLSLTGKVVICSVHQPSWDLFKEFSSILLMAEGKLLFHGTHEQCRRLFESINLRCPMNYNPAEFYIRALSNGRGYIEKILEMSPNGFSECRETSEITDKGSIKMTQRHWCKQVELLLWRSSISLKRDIRNQLLQLFLSVMASSLVIGTCYMGISGNTQRGIQDIRGFLWLMTSEVCFGLSYNALYAFDAEITLFKREAGMYSCSAYFVNRLLNYIPRCIVWPITLVFIATLAVELPNHVVTALEFTAALIGAGFASVAYGLGMSAVFISSGVMGDVMPCADLPLFLMSGAFLRITSIPLWLYPLKYISHFYYAMDAISNLYWRQIYYIDCPSNSTTLCIKDGPSVLLENGYSANFIFEDCLGLMFITILWSLLAYWGLKREEKKGYAY
ncbi:protein brown isoform X1 [Manduca sexta]|uniref:protein brown isoform X1 n=1 Tax=Manduca sexta TaxID=7130 RepID=UPI001183BD12|nr:protein brown isoform X1 [Manduca sexta]